MPTRVLYFGTPAFSAAFLEALINDTAFDVVGVVCQPDEPQGRKKIITPPPTKVLAQERGVPVILQPTKLKEETFLKTVTDLKADLFVIVAYGRILPNAILNQPSLGTVNVHPSLLPLWRGPSPMQAAIANRDTQTGISIMKIDDQMDHGPLLAQITLPLTGKETTPDLTATVIERGAPLLVETLKDYIDGKITPVEQNHDQATYCKLLTKEDGRFNPELSAEATEAAWRAYQPWPGLTATIPTERGDITAKLLGLEMTSDIFPAGSWHVVNDCLLVGTTSTALKVTSLQPATSKAMNAEEFLRGHQLKT
ncbi:methionyl-tRNA formyltransferase [Patescibacteria group bacterium]|nr:methionyl-tRNA formyltransferase [Patescibacteria group bacterium]